MEDIEIAEVRAWAAEAGEIARRYFNHSTARRKADRSLVSDADEAIERMLVARITARYPTHGIIGEEHARRPATAEYLWALDPLDGTAGYLAGLPTWAISIGVLRGNAPFAGVVYLPILGDCYWTDGSGRAFLNDLPIAVRDPDAWESEDWLAAPSDIHRTFTIDFVGKVRCLSCIAASVAYVARGSAVAALVSQGQIWDLAAAGAVLGAAGGVLVGLSGTPLDLAELLDGRPIREPLVAAAPTQAARFRQAIRWRAAPPVTSV